MFKYLHNLQCILFKKSKMHQCSKINESLFFIICINYIPVVMLVLHFELRLFSVTTTAAVTAAAAIITSTTTTITVW
jgi:hypothetical protein